MVERLGAGLRRFERDRQLLLHPLLTDELVEAARAERLFELFLLGDDGRNHDLSAHAALFNA